MSGRVRYWDKGWNCTYDSADADVKKIRKMLIWSNPFLEPARSQEAAREFAGEILRAVEQLTAREELERQAREFAPYSMMRWALRDDPYADRGYGIAALALMLCKS